MWLHNGNHLHVEMVDNRILQVTNNASGMSRKDKDIAIIKQALHRSFTSLSSPSTMVPLDSTFKTNPSANTIFDSKQENTGQNAHIVFEENGKVKIKLCFSDQ